MSGTGRPSAGERLDLALMKRTLVRILLLGLVALEAGCVKPCESLLEAVCVERPRPELCAQMRRRDEEGELSDELCRATREVFYESLERGRPSTGRTPP